MISRERILHHLQNAFPVGKVLMLAFNSVWEELPGVLDS